MTQPSERKQALTAIVFSNFGHAFSHMFTLLYATAVLYLPKVFDLPYGELLGLSSLGLVLFGVAALPAGWLGDQWSQIGMMLIFFIGVGVGSIIVGMAGADGLFIGLTLIGLFASIYHPVGIAWIVAWAKKQGMTLGINGVFGNAGSAIEPVFVGLMIDFVTWRAAFIVPGAFSVLCGIGLLVVWKAGGIRDVTTDRTPAGAPDSSAFVRVFIVLTVTMACTGFVYTGLTNTMPKLMEMGLSAALAASYTEIGIFVGVISGLASFSSVFGGWMADRYSARSIYIVFWALNSDTVFRRLAIRCSASGGAPSGFEFHAGVRGRRKHAGGPVHAVSLAGFGLRCQVRFGFEHRGLTVHLAGWLFDRNGDHRRCCGVHVTRRPPETGRSGGGGLMSLKVGNWI